jgi:ribosome-binding protein aMBF1 (putative translation factor)
MANKLVNCECCSNMALEVNLKTIHTSKGQMKVCKKCFDSDSEAIKLFQTAADGSIHPTPVDTKQETSEATN